MQNHIKHILVAEFDIDKGSQLSHQYPEKTGIEEHKLAELMLPDGAHLREEDWTFFILNQHVVEDSISNLSEQQEGYISKGFENFQPVLSVCCFTYNEDSWKRIIESDEVFLHLLQDKILIINRYLKLIGEIKPDIIIDYQDDINDYTVKLITKSKIYGFRFFNEEDYRLALITFRSLLYQRPPLNTEDANFPELPLPAVNNEGNTLYVLNLVRTKQIPNVRRGARVKAIAITSQHKWLHVFKPLLVMALDNYFETPELFIIEQLYKSMNSLDISLMPLLSLNEKIILRASDDPMLFNESFVEIEEFAKTMNKYNGTLQNNQMKKIDRHFFETNVLYDNGNKNPVKVPIKIPMTMFNGEFGDLSVIQLISTFGNSAYPTKHHPQLDNNIPTNPIIILINALLTQKRVLFLGHLKPSGEVANFVLAACALGSCGILRGYSERCFPYTNLAGLDDLLKVPGFIAGVTNPAFEEHPQWWDVLFNINTGKVTISPNIERAPPIENPLFNINEKEMISSSMDKEFMNDIMNLIQQKYGEHYIRERFRLYLLRFIEVASEYERIIFNRTKIGYSHETIHDKYKIGVGAYFPDDISKRREIAYNINRIEGWRRTRSYELYVKDFHKNLLRRSVRYVDIRRQALSLRNEVAISDEHLNSIMTALAENISTDEQVLEFLTHFLHNQGGLLPIAYPLLHSSESVRINCTKILVRLDYSPIGTRILSHLNPFFKLAYEKSAQKYEKRWGKNWYLTNNESREILQNQSSINDNPLTSPSVIQSNVVKRTSGMASNSVHNLTDNKLYNDETSNIDSQNKIYSNQRKGSIPKIIPDNYSLPVPPRQVESNIKIRVKSKNTDDSNSKSGKYSPSKAISSPDSMRSPNIKKGSPISSPSQNYKIKREKSNGSTPASINSNRSRSNSYKNINNSNNNSFSNTKSSNSVSSHTSHSRNKSYDLSSDSESESDLISNDDLDDEEVLKNINKHIQNDISYCDVLEDDLINLYNVNSSKEISEESRIFNDASLEMSKINIDDSKISQPINLDDNSLFSDRINNYPINNNKNIINNNNNVDKNSNNVNNINNINSNNVKDNNSNSSVNNSDATSTPKLPNNGMVFSKRKDSFNHPYGDHAEMEKNILFSNRKDDLKNINNLSTELFSEEEDIEGYSRAYSLEKYNNSRGTIENSYLDGTFSSFTTTTSHSPTLSTNSSISNDKGKNKSDQDDNNKNEPSKGGIYHFGQYGDQSGVQSSDVDLSNSHLIPDYETKVKDDKLVIPVIPITNPTSTNPVIQKILQKQQLSIQKFNNMDSF